ncbi:MAG: hypothetical protein II881_00855, partial [Oscillospiraceae bacterium]|nr:hypothetical protein [Oscillospiraceae bacterium]
GLYDFLLKFACVFLVRYSFQHITTPHLLVVYHTCLTNGVLFKSAAVFVLRQDRFSFAGRAAPKKQYLAADTGGNIRDRPFKYPVL